MQRLPLLAVLFAALLGLAAPSGAMSVRPLSLAQVVAGATWIVHGHVTTSRAEAVPGKLLASRTRHTLYVWDTVAGTAPEGDGLVDVVLPGGSRGPWQTVVPGVPSLATGDEVVLCLRETPWGWQPVGYGMGTWIVRADGAMEHQWEGTPLDAAPTLGPLGTPSLDDLIGDGR